MKISEHIEHLKTLQAEQGDLEFEGNIKFKKKDLENEAENEDLKFVSYEVWVLENPWVVDLYPAKPCKECDGEGGRECPQCEHERKCENCNGEGVLGGEPFLRAEYKKQCERDKKRWLIYLCERDKKPLPVRLAEEKDRYPDNIYGGLHKYEDIVL